MFNRDNHLLHLFVIIFFSSSVYAADSGTAVGIFTRIMQNIAPAWFGPAPKPMPGTWQQQLAVGEQVKTIEKATGVNINSDVSVQQTDGRVVDIQQTTVSVEVVQPKVEQQSARYTGLVVGGTDAKNQFLQPGQKQPQDYNQGGNNGQFYNDGKGSVGYTTTVGGANVSVGTDAGSLIRFAQDLTDVVLQDTGPSMSPSEKYAAAEQNMLNRLNEETKGLQGQYFGKSEQSLLDKKAQLEQHRTQISKQSTDAFNKSQNTKQAKIMRQVAQQEYGRLSYEMRTINKELAVINQNLEGYESARKIRQSYERPNNTQKQVIHTAATAMVLTQQTSPATKTDTVSMVQAGTLQVELVPATQDLKSLTSSTPQSSTSYQTSDKKPPVLTQAKDGATFFVNNMDPAATLHVVQQAEVTADALKDDGAIDYLLGKPAKVALGSCLVAAGVPIGIATACPPCAPFVAPAVALGTKYCLVSLPVAAGSAVLENGAHIAGYETTITKTRRKWDENAKKLQQDIKDSLKPEYKLSDEQYFDGLKTISTDKLEKMKSDSHSLQWRLLNYSPFSIDQYVAQNEARHGKLIDEELEIRQLRAVNEMSDNDVINSLKNHNTDYIKTLKQNQEAFVKAGDNNNASRKDKYLASRAKHFLQHTDQELQSREHTGARLKNAGPLKSTVIQEPKKQKPGCGSGLEHREPDNGLLINNPPPSKKEKPGCVYPPVEVPKPLINVPVQPDWRDYILTDAKAVDKNKQQDKGQTEEKKRYDGPTYGRTENWIDNSLFGKEFERTEKGMQGKRAFRLKKKIPALTGISEGEYVVVDAAHKDHLEVYNKHGDWTHVANFDGTKNVEKTKQGEKETRQKLKNL